jgi:Cof subfamily protein (haloacid dehalogenase superfamily)
VRVVLLRTGVVLDRSGGALAKMLTPFRFFVGGPVGVRPYWMSWIHWRDWVELVHLALSESAVRGPLNVTSPNPVTNWQFAREIGATLGRPWWLAVPGPVLRLAVGAVAGFITASQRVIPRAALDRGFTFVFGQLESAVESLLGGGAGAPFHVAFAGNHQPEAARANRKSTGAGEPGALHAAAPSQRIRLLACDVEGALLGPDQALDPRVIEACRAAQTAGCVVVLASGRPPQALRPIGEALGITAPVIAFHGALIWNPVESKPQYHEALAGSLVRDMINLARTVEPELCIGVEVLDRWYTDRVDQALLDDANVVSPPSEIGPVEAHLNGPVTRLSLYGRPQQLERALPVLKQQYWMTRRIALYTLRPTRVQLLHPLADTGIALQRVAARLGAQRNQVMAIGQGLNDAGMIEWAGFGVAVANACERVRHLADATVASNSDGGVAEAIERFVLAPAG